MRHTTMTALALVGLVTGPAGAAWPTFGNSVPPQSITAPETGSFWSKLNPWKSDAQTTPSMPPYYGALAPQPESSTQKFTRMINPTKWFASSDEASTELSDPISLANTPSTASPELRVAIAQMAEAKGNTAEARQLMEQARAESPKNVQVLREYARLEDRAGRLPEAEQLYRQAVATDPKNSAVRNDLGLCLARAGKLQESAQVLQSAIELQPKKALYRNNLATVLVELGDTQAALAHLAAVHSPPAAHYNLGQLFLQRGRTTEATGCFQAALRIDPAMQPAQAALARMSQGSGQFAARQSLQPAPTPADLGAPIAPVSAQSPNGPAFPVPRSLPPVE